MCVRMSMTIGLAAFPATTGQAMAGPSPASPLATQSGRTSSDPTVTLTGCIQREADYRRSIGAGGGGATGTGAGLTDEFVLIEALAPTTGSATAPTATGTSGTTGTTYALTGSHEGDAGALVGKRVEIIGTVKQENASPRARGASDAANPEVKLRELDVSTVRETPGSCSTEIR
jgi:hypothetical protein